MSKLLNILFTLFLQFIHIIHILLIWLSYIELTKYFNIPYISYGQAIIIGLIINMLNIYLFTSATDIKEHSELDNEFRLLVGLSRTIMLLIYYLIILSVSHYVI